MFSKIKSLFSNSTKIVSSVSFDVIKADMHSHLLPGIDDGVKDIEESIAILKYFREKGYRKVITTPHIMKGTYDNTSEIIRERLQIVREEIQKQQLDIQLDACAEYFLDSHFLDLLFKDDLLSFGKENYILVELSYLLKQNDYQNIFLNISQSRFQPILAHPERYSYFFDNHLTQFKQIKEQGILFQLNLFSVLGVYGERTKFIAERLIKENLIDFVGTDIHKSKHIEYVEACLENKTIQHLLQSGKLRNPELI